jgi:hypothetical protein
MCWRKWRKVRHNIFYNNFVLTSTTELFWLHFSVLKLGKKIIIFFCRGGGSFLNNSAPHIFLFNGCRSLLRGKWTWSWPVTWEVWKAWSFILMLHMCLQSVVLRYRGCFTFTLQMHKENNKKWNTFSNWGSHSGDYEYSLLESNDV